MDVKLSSQIRGVGIAPLKIFADTRGRFIETFRKEWFPQRSWQVIQTNRSESRAGVIRGLHYHRHQVDYWYVVNGRIRAALFDIRPDSPTFRHAQTVELGEQTQLGLFIPTGVAHGFAALTDTTLTYIVDQYYNPDDEFGIAWNDPVAAIKWGIEDPLISERDAQNPFLSSIPEETLPRLDPNLG